MATAILTEAHLPLALISPIFCPYLELIPSVILLYVWMPFDAGLNWLLYSMKNMLLS
jgi:hypothetical protein